MKHQCKLLTILMSWLLSANAAQAALTSNGNGLVYDSLLNVTWSSDANLLGTMLASDPSLVSKIIAAVPAVTNTPNVYSPTGIHTLSAADFYIANPGVMNWFGAKAFVGYLNSSHYLGQNTWSLPAADPNCAMYNCINSQLGSLFYNSLGGVAGSDIAITHNSSYNLFMNVQGNYWFGTEYASNPNYAWSFYNNYGGQLANNPKISYIWSLAMLPGNVVAPVPELGEWAMMLAGFGLIGGIAKRRKLV
ncbi:MAG: hypothetical protein K2P57_08515 [Burkholderiales bacterium]|nr:hypothetical protein [Burkholderiales bacterium]